MRGRQRLVVIAVLYACLWTPGDAWTSETTVRMPASTRYERNRVHRFVFGGGYRPLG